LDLQTNLLKQKAARMNKRRPAQGKQSKPMGEDVDLYDLIKGHLIDEGFADTEEAAHSIMANMSEEWRQSIVEGSCMGDRKKKKKK